VRGVCRTVLAAALSLFFSLSLGSRTGGAAEPTAAGERGCGGGCRGLWWRRRSPPGLAPPDEI
jgi:Spy/CpxP family protein refolding chaperone